MAGRVCGEGNTEAETSRMRWNHLCKELVWKEPWKQRDPRQKRVLMHLRNRNVNEKKDSRTGKLTGKRWRWTGARQDEFVVQGLTLGLYFKKREF